MTFEVGFRSVGVRIGLGQHGFKEQGPPDRPGAKRTDLIQLRANPHGPSRRFRSSDLSIGFAIVNAVLYLTPLGADVPRGTTLIITALFFFSGVQLFFMGFIGEYILSIFNQVRSRPLVVECERINFDDDPDTPKT